MTSIALIGNHPVVEVKIDLALYKLDAQSYTANAYTYERLATDPIGTFTLTLTNVVVGSAIRIEAQVGGALVEYRVATLTTEIFSVPVYVSGSASNDLRIKVRKATAGTAYIPYETLTTAATGAQSIYVSQIPDE